MHIFSRRLKKRFFKFFFSETTQSRKQIKCFVDNNISSVYQTDYHYIIYMKDRKYFLGRKLCIKVLSFNFQSSVFNLMMIPTSKVNSEPCPTSKVERFAKTVNC